MQLCLPRCLSGLRAGRDEPAILHGRQWWLCRVKTVRRHRTVQGRTHAPSLPGTPPPQHPSGPIRSGWSGSLSGIPELAPGMPQLQIQLDINANGTVGVSEGDMDPGTELFMTVTTRVSPDETPGGRCPCSRSPVFGNVDGSRPRSDAEAEVPAVRSLERDTVRRWLKPHTHTSVQRRFHSRRVARPASEPEASQPTGVLCQGHDRRAWLDAINAPRQEHRGDLVSEGGLELLSLSKHLDGSYPLDLRVWPIWRLGNRVQMRPDTRKCCVRSITRSITAPLRRGPTAMGDAQLSTGHLGGTTVARPASVLHHLRQALLLDPAVCGAVRQVFGQPAEPGPENVLATPDGVGHFQGVGLGKGARDGEVDRCPDIAECSCSTSRAAPPSTSAPTSGARDDRPPARVNRTLGSPLSLTVPG
jgi:hypothetical protein